MLKLELPFLACSCLIASCAHMDAPAPPGPTAALVREAPIGVTPRSQITPLLDAHQHMMSLAATAIPAPQPSPPPVVVPTVVSNLLSARENLSDQASYAELFTPDALVYAEEEGRWWTGEERILDALGNFPSERRFVPTSYALGGSAGYIAGILRTPSGEDTHNFVLGIKKAADGRWRIASEMKQAIMPAVMAPPITAEDVIEQLDDAGIRYGTVLSLAYWFDQPEREIEGDRHAKTRAENDWVVAETAKYSDRLIPFCGVNPLTDYAVEELERCASIPRVRGMKIHRNSRFDLSHPEHLAKMQQFFRAANRHGLAIVMHTRGEVPTLIDQVLPEAPDVPIQIAHMGSGWANAKLFADAIQAGKPGTKNLWFDWTQALPIAGLWTHGRPGGGLGGTVSPEGKAKVVRIMRTIGMDRILYGSDMPLPWNPTPREWWRKTILTLPLTDEEIRDIADNLPPYVR